jgi:hypothetical protein
MEALPQQLRGGVLNYKTWKQLATTQSLALEEDLVTCTHLKRLLIVECMAVERVLRVYSPVSKMDYVWTLVLRACLFVGGACSSVKVVDHNDVVTSDLLDFIVLNRDTLRKICKRVDKIYATSSSFTRDVYGSMRFSFIQGALVSRLELELGIRAAECPVCLWCEAHDSDMQQRLVILDCGHTVCVDCFESMFGRKFRKGLECPVCRCTLPHKKLLFWPGY